MATDVRLSRRGMMRGAVLLSALRQLGCGEQSRALVKAEAEPQQSAEPVMEVEVASQAQTCAAPTAYVMGGPATNAARTRQLLEQAGFELLPLPLDRAPLELRGLIVIPSFSSEAPEYEQYMQQHAEQLSEFVDAANVLLQLPQQSASEAGPAFLPVAYGLKREQAVVGGVEVQNSDHALLRSLETEAGEVAWKEPEAGTQVFVHTEGFEVLLADSDEGRALLIETAYGQGRFLLSALALDREPGDPAEAEFVRVLFTNLFEYVSSVCARTVEAIRLSPSAPSTAFSAGSSLLAVLPDTQFYSLRYPGLYHAQTSWIRANAQARDIRYAIHLGDIVHLNTRQEWDRAASAMAQLHGVVPYALAPGNHDYGPSGNASTRDTHLNEYFSFQLSAAMPSFGGAYEQEKLDNSYHLFSIQGRDFIVMALEWGPRDEVVAWADQVMSQHAERQGILVTHAYLNNNDRRYDHTDKDHSQRFNPHDYTTPGGVNDGEELWQKLVRRHRFAMTLNGHVLGDGCGYLASVTDHGNVCHQMLSNYQMREQGGEGYMRLLEFLDDGRSVRVFTYSPLYDGFLDVPGHNFTIMLD